MQQSVFHGWAAGLEETVCGFRLMLRYQCGELFA